jgi:hypothetical protein
LIRLQSVHVALTKAALAPGVLAQVEFRLDIVALFKVISLRVQRLKEIPVALVSPVARSRLQIHSDNVVDNVVQQTNLEEDSV